MQKKWMAVLLSMTFIGNSVVPAHAAEIPTTPVTQEPINEQNGEPQPDIPDIGMENIEIEEWSLSTPPSPTSLGTSDETQAPDAVSVIPSELSSELSSEPIPPEAVPSEPLSEEVIPSEAEGNETGFPLPEEAMEEEAIKEEVEEETAAVPEELVLSQGDILMLYDKEEIKADGMMKHEAVAYNAPAENSGVVWMLGAGEAVIATEKLSLDSETVWLKVEFESGTGYIYASGFEEREEKNEVAPSENNEGEVESDEGTEPESEETEKESEDISEAAGKEGEEKEEIQDTEAEPVMEPESAPEEEDAGELSGVEEPEEETEPETEAETEAETEEDAQEEAEQQMKAAAANVVSSLFPESYRIILNQLAKEHPNWKFIPMLTNLDFGTVLANEQSLVNRNLVEAYENVEWKSTETKGIDANGNVYNYDWATDEWYRWEPNFVAASDEAVAYTLDPRNFLTNTHIFMFESLGYQEFQTASAVDGALKNTFMYQALVPGQKEYTYAELFEWIGKTYDISPIMLASRVRQEQGVNGTSELISGTYPGYENLYNYFNCNASGKTRELIIKAGLEEARRGSAMILPDGSEYNGPWDTPTKSIIGGALYVANKFVLVGQDTLYLQKYDVDNTDGKLYWHQYMQAIKAPMSESVSVRKSYESLGLVDSAISFRIPVFNNMPTTTALAAKKNPNAYLKTISVNGSLVMASTDLQNTSFTATVPYGTTKAVVSGVPVSAKATVSGPVTLSIASAGSSKTATLTAKAEDGTTRAYKVTVTMAHQDIPEVQSITVSTPTKDGYTIKAVLSHPETIDHVQIPTWTSANGQDDLKWYEAAVSGNTATVFIPFSEHKYESGKYISHVYAYNQEGKCKVSGKEYEIKESAVAGTITNAAAANVTVNGFSVTASASAIAGIQSVKAKVWNNANGASTAAWYTMALSNGKYTATVPITDHKNAYGAYTAQITLTDKAGHQVTKNITATVPKKATTVNSLVSSNVTENGFKATATFTAPYGYKSILLKVWPTSQKEANAKWYSPTASGSTVTYTVNVSDFNNASGVYYARIALTDKDGNVVTKDMASVTVPQKTVLKIDKITVSNITYSGYDVQVNFTAANGVKSVEMPTWTSANGQDDIIWHKATVSGNTAKYHVNVSDHKNESGVYVTHVYVKDTKGGQVIGGTTITVPKKKVLAINSVTVSDVTASGYKITAKFEATNGVKEVMVPTWTRNNGQDDIIWHKAAVSGNTATFTVKASDHKNESGVYISHVYVYDKTGASVVMAKEVTVSKMATGYDLIFTATYYLNKYPDLKAAFGTNAAEALNHFKTNGMAEGRQAIDTFNVQVYKNRYADLRAAFGNNLKLYYEHYMNNGAKEGRTAY